VKQQSGFCIQLSRFDSTQFKFSPAVKCCFKHHLKLRWIGKSTSSRHECKSLRCSWRSTASGHLCSAERSLTLSWEPHQIITVNVLPHDECQLHLWRGEEAVACRGWGEWGDDPGHPSQGESKEWIYKCLNTATRLFLRLLTHAAWI